MADYKESNVSGTQWQRCNGVYIQNSYKNVPNITLREEKVTEIGEELFFKDMGQIDFQFNPNAVIQLLNPVDGTPTGATMSMGEMYIALWSLYMTKAAERDTVQAVSEVVLPDVLPISEPPTNEELS
jgi:hypothetical protein